jgi:hypothetical protein
VVALNGVKVTNMQHLTSTIPPQLIEGDAALLNPLTLRFSPC